jgi:chromosome partitioning protein
MAILPFINLKGGVGKTVTAVAIAECIASWDKSHRVLVIDADHQCSASELLLGERRQRQTEEMGQTLYHLLKDLLEDDFDPAGLDSFVTRKGSNIGGGMANLSVLPSSIMIEDIETNIAKAKSKYAGRDFQSVWTQQIKQVRSWLSKHYDYVIIDCPPSLNKHVRFLLRASDAFVVPCVPDRLSARGAKYLMRRLKNYGIKTPGLGTLWTLYRDQSDVHKKIVSMGIARHEQLRDLPSPLETIIPMATPIGRACEEDKPASQITFVKKYSSPFAQVFREATSELMARAAKLPLPAKKLAVGRA